MTVLQRCAQIHSLACAILCTLRYTIHTRNPAAAGHKAPLSAAAATATADAAAVTRHEELTKYHCLATSRLSTRGYTAFFGTNPEVRHQRWTDSGFCGDPLAA